MGLLMRETKQSNHCVSSAHFIDVSAIDQRGSTDRSITFVKSPYFFRKKVRENYLENYLLLDRQTHMNY
jgi:hypothetical protein